MDHHSDIDISKPTNEKPYNKNPKLTMRPSDLIILKKDDLSIIDEHYEPSLGIQENNLFSAVEKREEIPLENEFSLGGPNCSQIADLTSKKPLIKQQWTKNGLNIIRLVTKFIKQLKTHTQTFQYKMLNEKVLSLLGDKASNTKVAIQLKKQFFKQKMKWSFSDLKMDLLFFIPSLQPDNPFLVFYKILLFMFLVINILYFPIETFYSYYPILKIDELSIYFESIPVIFCFADIGLSFFTSFYAEGILYSSKSKIITNYLKSNFVFDAICVLPFFNLHTSIQYLKLVRIIKLKITLSSIEEVIYFRQKVQGCWELMKQVFFILYVWHLFSCLWHWLGMYGMESQLKNWIQEKGLEHAQLSEQYFYSLYFIIITTLTIGFGDFVPYNLYEIQFTMIIAFTGCCILGYTINNIGEIFKSINESEDKFKLQMKSIQQYLKDYHINQKLSLQIRKYFQYHLRAQIESNNDGHQIMHQLSKNLKEQMQIDLYKKHLQKVRIIQQYCSQETIEKMCQYIEIDHYVPEAQIINQGSTPQKLYYVLEGELKMYITLGNKQDVTVVGSLKQGSVIGQWEFLQQHSYLYSVKATKFTKVLSILTSDYIKIISENQDDFEKFSQMKDENIFKIKQLGKKCFFCEWIHYFDKCPFVFFKPDKEKLMASHLQNEYQQRQNSFRRKDKPKNSSILKSSVRRQAALDFIFQSDNDVQIQQLIDMGFNSNDSVLSNAINLNEFESKTGDSVINENYDNSPSTPHGKPAVFIQAPQFMMIYNDARETFINLKSNTNDQLFNRQTSSHKSKKGDSKQHQLKPLSTGKPELKVSQHKRYEINNLQRQISSNLNILQTQNSNAPNELTDNLEEKDQIDEKVAIQQVQQLNATINLDIDKYFIFKNYFVEANIDKIVQNLIDQQTQFRLKKPKKYTFSTSGRHRFSNRILLSQKKKIYNDSSSPE